MDLAGEAVGVGVDLRARPGHDALRRDEEVGVEERGEHRREGAWEVADLVVAGVKDGDALLSYRLSGWRTRPTVSRPATLPR